MESRQRWQWLLRDANASGPPDTVPFSYGNPSLGDIPVVGDWNGDGTATIGVVRPDAQGHLLWLLRDANTPGPPTITFVYGSARQGDVPLAGDWDGSGTDTPGVVRPDETGHLTWYLRSETGPGPPDLVFQYGSVVLGDFPIRGDWDGNGTDTPGVVRVGENSRFVWLLRNRASLGPPDLVFTYGSNARGDLPLAGKWNGDASAGVGVARPDSAGHWRWLLRTTPDAGPPDVPPFLYGSHALGDVPIAGNWDPDPAHTETVGVARPVGP